MSMECFSCRKVIMEAHDLFRNIKYMNNKYESRNSIHARGKISRNVYYYTQRIILVNHSKVMGIIN